MTEQRAELLIGGVWEPAASSERVEVISPSTEQVIATVPRTTAVDVDRAVSAARAAFDKGDWAQLPVEERAVALERLASSIESRVEPMANAITACMGAPIAMAAAQPWGAAALARSDAAQIRSIPATELRQGMVAAASVEWEPVGVVAAIPAWNGSLYMNVLKLAPALAAGCTVVLKPAAEAPLDAFLLADAVVEAGFPEGVVSVIPGDGTVGEALVVHEGIDMVTFTGSVETGRRVGAACGGGLKRHILELGGKSAAIVLEDVDLATLVSGIQFGTFGNSGQMCNAFTRLLVPRGLYDEVVDAVVQGARQLVVGDPFDPATTLGPLGSSRQRDRVEEFIASGVAQGARLVLGGGRPADLDKGWYIEPTIFADVDNSMRIAREEIFGPVLSVIAYEGDENAVQIANDSHLGLHGAVFSADEARAYGIAKRIRTGTFSINGYVANPGVPFGGFKCSGIGRESGIEGLRSYQEIKTINLPEALAASMRAQPSA